MQAVCVCACVRACVCTLCVCTTNSCVLLFGDNTVYMHYSTQLYRDTCTYVYMHHSITVHSCTEISQLAIIQLFGDNTSISVQLCTVMHVYICTCISVQLCTVMHVYICTCISVQLCTVMHVYICTCISVQLCTVMHVYMYLYTAVYCVISL